MELLLSYLCRDHQEGTGRGLSEDLGASPGPAVADRVGSPARPSQPAGAGLHCEFIGLDFHCLSSALRSGTEPGRVYLGLLEAARVTQCLPQGLLATERSSATNATSNAPPSAADHRPLEAIFFVARMTLYYARLSNRKPDSSAKTMWAPSRAAFFLSAASLFVSIVGCFFHSAPARAVSVSAGSIASGASTGRHGRDDTEP